MTNRFDNIDKKAMPPPIPIVTPKLGLVTDANFMRLNKYLSSVGFCSRRDADKLITTGRVKINHKIALLGDQVNPGTDQISVDNKSIKNSPSSKYYYALNKPVGVVSTTRDTHGRQTVVDLVSASVKLFPIGRLDINSSGLIILTNDGNLALRLTHPRYHLSKTYLVKIKGDLNSSVIGQFQKGVLLDDGQTLPANVKKITNYSFQITLFEGRKRQIRRMCAVLHLHVVSLTRIKIGPVSLGDLLPGQHRPLTASELNQLLPRPPLV